MEKRKAVQDAEVASKTIERGVLIVHTGPGKGKSTAAWGLALRALGNGWRVGVVQFIKGGWQTGERAAFERFGDRVSWHTMGEGFTWETQDKGRDIAAAKAAWAKARELMADAQIRLLILDELNIALRYDYLPLDDVIAELKPPARSDGGRDGPQRQARPHSRGRLRNRDGRGEASFRSGLQGAGGIEY